MTSTIQCLGRGAVPVEKCRPGVLVDIVRGGWPLVWEIFRSWSFVDGSYTFAELVPPGGDWKNQAALEVDEAIYGLAIVDEHGKRIDPRDVSL